MLGIRRCWGSRWHFQLVMCAHKNSGVTLTGTFAWVHPFFISSTETGLRAKLMIWQHARQGERDPFLLHTTSSLLNIPIGAPIGYSLCDWIFFFNVGIVKTPSPFSASFSVQQFFGFCLFVCLFLFWEVALPGFLEHFYLRCSLDEQKIKNN